ncbi:MAG: GNAT family N-acetyltransferase, partial [Chloroflexota bacterium]
MMNIRPFNFSDRDYETAVALRNELYPDNLSTVEIWKHNDLTRRQDPTYHFFVAENDAGEMQAFVQCALNNPKSKKLTFGLLANPACLKDGTAEQLMLAVEQVADTVTAEKLICKIQESEEEKVEFLSQDGFNIVMRYPISALNVAKFNLEAHQQRVNATLENGIVVKQLPSGWQHDKGCQQFVHELDWQLMLDVPSHEPRTKKSLEAFLTEEIFHPNAFPESFFLAWEADKAVGL